MSQEQESQLTANENNISMAREAVQQLESRGVVQETAPQMEADSRDQSVGVEALKATVNPNGGDMSSKGTDIANRSDGELGAVSKLDMKVERYARTKEQRKNAKGKKAGHPGRFQGEMLELLESKLSDYEKLPAVGVAGRNGALSTFWDEVIQNGFWVEFSVADARGTIPHAELLSDKEVIACSNSGIKAWFRRKATDPKPANIAALWAPTIKALRQPAGGEPKKRAAWQVFMSKHATRIAAIFDEEKQLPENLKKADIALRTEIAKRLFAAADEEEVESIRTTINIEYEEKVAEKAHLETANTADPAVQKNARRMLATVITPLLEMISKVTGLGHLTLLCGSAPTESQNDYIVSAVHYGKTKGPVPQNFYTFDEEAFRVHVLPQFCKYLSATSEGEKAGQPSGSKLPENIDMSLTVPEDDQAVMMESRSTVPDTVVKRPFTPAMVVNTATPAAETASSAASASPDSSTVVPSTTTTSSTTAPANSQLRKARSPVGEVLKGKKRLTPHPIVKPTLRLRSDACALVVRRVRALTGTEREEEIRRLNALPDMEMRWENSDAVTESLVGSEPELPAFSLPSSASPPTTLTALNVSQEDAPHSGEDDLEDPSAVPPLDASLDNGANGVLGSNIEPASPLSTVEATLPPWIKQHAERLRNVSMTDELNSTWATLIHNWVLIEKLLDFQAPRDGFPPAGRPAAITLWVQNARRKSVVIQPDAYGRFVEAWFAWWSSINPEWRRREDGRLVIGGTGDWECMLKPGKCGFLLVLECLVGLREAASIDDLRASIRDVEWVSCQVLQMLKTRALNNPKQDRPDEDRDSPDGSNVLSPKKRGRDRRDGDQAHPSPKKTRASLLTSSVRAAR